MSFSAADLLRVLDDNYDLSYKQQLQIVMKKMTLKQAINIIKSSLFYKVEKTVNGKYYFESNAYLFRNICGIDSYFTVTDHLNSIVDEIGLSHSTNGFYSKEVVKLFAIRLLALSKITNNMIDGIKEEDIKEKLEEIIKRIIKLPAFW